MTKTGGVNHGEAVGCNLRWLSDGHEMTLNEWVQLNTGIEAMVQLKHLKKIILLDPVDSCWMLMNTTFFQHVLIRQGCGNDVPLHVQMGIYAAVSGQQLQLNARSATAFKAAQASLNSSVRVQRVDGQ